MEAAFLRFRPSTSERLSHVQSPLWEEFLNVRISIRDSGKEKEGKLMQHDVSWRKRLKTQAIF